MARKLPSLVENSQRFANLASYLIITLMMVCFSITFFQLIKWLTYQPDNKATYHFQWELLPLILLFVSVEAIFSRSIAREFEGREKIIYHAAEWITFAVLCKLSIYLTHGFDQLPLDLPRWQDNFFSFFEGEFLYTYFLMLVIWTFSRISANNIDGLNVDPTDTQWEYGKLVNSRAAIRGALVNRVFWIGLAMVFATALIRFNLFKLNGPADLQAPVISVMAYFFLALALFSQTQYALLQGRWFWHQTPVDRFLSRTWIRYSLIFFAILAIISFLLPTGYSMGLLETLQYVLLWLANAFMLLLQLILLPVIWLLSLVGCTRQPQSDESPAPSAQLPQIAPPVPAAPLPWLEMLKSILFWIIFIGIIAYALTTFIRQNPQFAAAFRHVRVFGWIGRLWGWLTRWLREIGSQATSAIHQARIRLFPQRERTLLSQIRHWANFRQLNDRQKIIFFYIRLLERGREHGIARKPYETPNQYAGSLETSIPEVHEEIHGMTETFLEARYSPHEIGEYHSNLVQRFWRNIARSLDRLRKPSADPHS